MLNLFASMMLLISSPSAESKFIVASWYHTGTLTASGEVFNPHKLTAAHKTLPFGTRVKLRYKDRSVTVRINDRGPYIKGRRIDLSKGAARVLKFKGVDKVEVLAVKYP